MTRLYEEYVSRMRKRTAEFLTGKVSNTDQHSVLFIYVLHMDVGPRDMQPGFGVHTKVFLPRGHKLVIYQ